MSKTMFLAFGLAVVACAHPADEEETGLLQDEASSDPASDGDGGDCAAEGDFDVEVFAAEVLPILTGEIDLNHPGEPSLVSCTRGPCHDNERPGGFYLLVNDTAENNLERFACFVDLDRPKRSQVLVCPSDDERCVPFPHPGPALLSEHGDLNYARILSYIRESRP